MEWRAGKVKHRALGDSKCALVGSSRARCRSDGARPWIPRAVRGGHKPEHANPSANCLNGFDGTLFFRGIISETSGGGGLFFLTAGSFTGTTGADVEGGEADDVAFAGGPDFSDCWGGGEVLEGAGGAALGQDELF